LCKPAGRIETSQLDAGQYVLNAEGYRNGVPVDMAARRLWGVPVTVTTGVPSGTGYLLSSGVVQIVTDGQLATEWSNATADDFTRNQVSGSPSKVAPICPSRAPWSG